MVPAENPTVPQVMPACQGGERTRMAAAWASASSRAPRRPLCERIDLDLTDDPTDQSRHSRAQEGGALKHLRRIRLVALSRPVAVGNEFPGDHIPVREAGPHPGVDVGLVVDEDLDRKSVV